MKIYCLNTNILTLLQLVLFSNLVLPLFELSLSLHFPDGTSCGAELCKLLNCGQGKCVESKTSILGADCECNPGWEKIQFGPLTFPSCLIPNCTVDFHCGIGSPTSAPAPVPPPPPSPPPAQSWLPNFSNPCNFVWCGDGSCKPNGRNYTCECNAGSVNLLNSTTLACFKQCYLGGDCSNLNIVVQSSPPPPALAPNSLGSCIHGLRSLYGWAILLQTLIIACW